MMNKNRTEPAGGPVREPQAPERQQPNTAGIPARKPFPTVGDLFAMLGIALGMQVVAGVAATAVFLLTGWKIGALTPQQQGVFTALAYLLSMLPAYLLVMYYRRIRGGSGPVGRFSKCGLNPVLLLWGFLFMLAAEVVCEPLLSLLPAPPDPNYGRGIWAVLTLVVVAPVLEELLCRGVVLGALRKRYGVVLAWLISSLFFGVLHVHPMLAVNAFVIGLILGYLYIATESLWAPMILHALNNAVAYLLLMAGLDGQLLNETIGNRTLYVIIYIGAVVVTLLSAWKVWRTLQRLKSETGKEASA